MWPLPCASVQSRSAGASASPKQTVAGSTVVASNSGVVRMATGMTPLLRTLTGFGTPSGLISISTGVGQVRNLKDTMWVVGGASAKGMYSLVYQKVQSSAGSTLMAL